MLVSAGGSGRRLPSPRQRHPGPVPRRETPAGRQQVHLPQPGGRGVPPAGVLLAALPVLQAAPHLQGTAALAPEKRGDGTGPVVAVWPVTRGRLLLLPLFTSMGVLVLATLSARFILGCSNNLAADCGKTSFRRFRRQSHAEECQL